MTDNKSLYERLGGAPGITAISNDLVDRHCANPEIKARFVNSDRAALKQLVFDFFSMGTGGPANYQGRDMLTTHTGMNINERELVAVLDDALACLDKHGIDPASRNEVLAILYSFKDEILFK